MMLERLACFELSLCLLPLCCAARTPCTPYAALALLPLVHRTRRATTAHAAPALALHSPGPACGCLERPCTRAPVPRARGACTRARQPRTQVYGPWGEKTTNQRHKDAPRGGKDAACPNGHNAGDADRWSTTELGGRPGNGVAAFLLPCERGSSRVAGVSWVLGRQWLKPSRPGGL